MGFRGIVYQKEVLFSCKITNCILKAYESSLLIPLKMTVINYTQTFTVFYLKRKFAFLKSSLRGEKRRGNLI